ncbi:MAG TPA: hypothetical protein VHA74_03715 [Candidatus Dojkabacteria bacterium]|nr:hypothetical protein [Candidatus Dojkabacteria bacterium]
MNYAKRELKRVRNKVAPLLEPFAIVALLSLFVLPALVLINLTPIASNKIQNTNNVLGLEDKPGNTGIVMVGGTHNIITHERFEAKDNGISVYATTIKARDAGTYSKPVLQIDNPSGHDVKVEFTGYSSASLYSDVSLKYDNNIVSIMNNTGAGNTGEIVIPSNKTVTVYLEITNLSKISFEQNLQIEVKVL